MYCVCLCVAQEKYGGSSVSACVFLLARFVSSRFCCRVSAVACLLSCFCCRVSADVFLLARFCWRVFCWRFVCWRIPAGAFLLARFCWRASAGALLRARICWRASAGAFFCRGIFQLRRFSAGPCFWRVSAGVFFPWSVFLLARVCCCGAYFHLVHVVRCCLFVLTVLLCGQRCYN